MDEMDALVSRANEFENLLGQLGDIGARKAAGILDGDEYIEQRARQLAYTAALAKVKGGEAVSDDEFDALLADMREVAAEPSQEEINAANIDYLMMIGGEE